MKRNEIVKKLMNEGFNEKTLVNMSDRQIELLSSRILSEQTSSEKTVNIKADVANRNPDLLKKIATTSNVQVNEEDEETCECNKTEMKEEKPSAGLTDKKKSEIVKKSKSGKDIGKKGKGFDEVVKSAKKSGSKNPQAVAAAAMWKNIKKENVETKENIETKKWVEKLVNENYHNLTTKGEISLLIKQKLNEQQLENAKLPLDTEDCVYADGVSMDQTIAQKIANGNAKSKFMGKFPEQEFTKTIETAHRTEDGNYRYIVGLKVRNETGGEVDEPFTTNNKETAQQTQSTN